MASFWMRSIIIASLIALRPLSASATMPVLTDMPSHRTPAACKKWAAKQDEDAIEMWSTQEDGTFPHKVGLRRLYLFCLGDFGDDQPEIVGFYSSIGASMAYCAKHPGIKICEDVAEEAPSVTTGE